MPSMVYITAKNEDEASNISRELLKRNLIACANIFRTRSIYRWEGKIEDAEEWAAVMKTRKALVNQVIKAIKEIHSYDIPCIVSYDIDHGNREYIDWIYDETDVAKGLDV
jgi:periplasmic divalent cation tolerance protein